VSIEPPRPSWKYFFAALAVELVALLVGLSFLVARIGDGCGEGAACRSDAAVFILLGVAFAFGVAAYLLAAAPTYAAASPIAAAWWSCSAVVSPQRVAGLMCLLQGEPDEGAVVIGAAALAVSLLAVAFRVFAMRRRGLVPHPYRSIAVALALILGLVVVGALHSLAGNRAEADWNRGQAQMDPDITSEYSSLPYVPAFRLLQGIDQIQTNAVYYPRGQAHPGESKLVDMSTKQVPASQDALNDKWKIKADYIDDGARALVLATDGSSEFLFDYFQPGIQDLESDLYCRGELCGLIAPTSNGLMLETAKDRKCKEIETSPDLWCHVDIRTATEDVVRLPPRTSQRLVALLK
jgi:hypothetical protein